MFLIVSKYLISKGYRAMALFPFVIVREKRDADNAVLINHERIHLRQQMELLVLPFYLWYFTDYLMKIVLYRNAFKAYRNIVFEREAYANEGNLRYLESRPAWKFLKYYSTI